MRLVNEVFKKRIGPGSRKVRKARNGEKRPTFLNCLFQNVMTVFYCKLWLQISLCILEKSVLHTSTLTLLNFIKPLLRCKTDPETVKIH